MSYDFQDDFNTFFFGVLGAERIGKCTCYEGKKIR